MSKLKSQTGPLGALGESNAPGSGTMSPPSGDAAKLGWSSHEYPTAGPATSQTQIKNTRNSVGSLGNDGTSRNSYQNQPDQVNAENPQVPTINNGGR